MMLSKPKGYKEEDVQALLSNADSEEQTTVDKEEMPNIIAIMNESFSDLNVVGDLQTSEDYMPFIHSMTKNTIKGQLLVSPFGGYTCNTEFEFLTACCREVRSHIFSMCQNNIRSHFRHILMNSDIRA